MSVVGIKQVLLVHANARAVQCNDLHKCAFVLI